MVFSMATIRDVAADAGVAASTVSYVLSGKKRLPDATVQRVLASVAKLGYRPSPAARALALGRTNVLGVLASVSTATPRTDIDIFMSFVRAAMYAARPYGYDVLVMARGDDELEGDILADAVLVMDIKVNEPRLPVLLGRGLVTVLIGAPDETLGLSAIDLDFAGAARVMVRRLSELGHRQIAVLAPPPEPDVEEFAYRYRFRQAFAEECMLLGISGQFVPCQGPTVADVEDWLEEVLAAQPGPTAILAMAVSSLDALHDILARRGLTVPGDVSVLAIAPEETLGRSHPQTSIVDLPGPEMVARAVDRAMAELAGEAGGAVELLPAVVIERGSTGLPGRGLTA